MYRNQKIHWTHDDVSNAIIALTLDSYYEIREKLFFIYKIMYLKKKTLMNNKDQ